MRFNHYWTKPDRPINALVQSALSCRQPAAFLPRFVANPFPAFLVKRINLSLAES